MTKITNEALGAAVFTILSALAQAGAVRPTGTGGAQSAGTEPDTSASAPPASSGSQGAKASGQKPISEQQSAGSDASPSTRDQAKADGPTLETITKLVMEIAKTRKDDVKALLAEFGVARAGELKTDQYVAFTEKLEALQLA